jgi:fatty acyl-CoA reductase
MTEHLLLDFINSSPIKVPLLIFRPSIISASLEEPVPGWTDSIGLIGGIYMVAGLGILRELPCNENNIGD